jgi:hypothetical protein
MAKFSVGQRVRIRKDVTFQPGLESFRGVETTITAPSFFYDDYWTLDIVAANGCAVCAASEALEPLTDPLADQFIADMKRFALLADKRPLGEILKDKLRLA